MTRSTVTRVSARCARSGMRQGPRLRGDAGDDERRSLPGGADAGHRARIEMEEIGLDAIREDHAARGHERLEHELAPTRNPSRDDARGGMATRERLAHGVERSEEHTSELQSQSNLVCRLLLEKKKKKKNKVHS